MPQTVLLCTGKSCKKKNVGVKELLEALDQDLVVERVRCQNICSGPVVGLRLNGRWEWFKRIRRPRQLLALLKSLKRDKIVDNLKKNYVKKRSGKRR